MVVIGIFIYGIQHIMLKDRNKMEKGDFEFKTASEIDTRLDDVKGIDEIKSEIKDLIRMLKNPQDYT